jgi:hypothetical protein
MSRNNILIVTLWILVLTCFPCRATELTGVATARDGSPLANVTVYSFDRSGTIMPPEGRSFTDRTDDQGRFKLRGHGQAVYFQRRDLQPLTKVIDYSQRVLDVVLMPAHVGWAAARCSESADYRRQSGEFEKLSSPFRWSFFVPREPTVRFKRIRDVDYIEYLFWYGSGENRSYLQGWFGLNAADKSISESSLVKSTTFEERWADLGIWLSHDIYGRTSEGMRWRYLSLETSAIYYETATDKAADVFDHMLSRICYERDER